jgi:hypothetical protein
MLKRLTILAVLGTFLAPAGAEASPQHKRLTSRITALSVLSVARGRLAVTRYEARAGGSVGACQAIDSLQVACEAVEPEELEWVALAVLHPRSHQISVSWPFWTELHPYSEPGV